MGVNGDYIPQCDLLNPLANGECGMISDLRFGQPIPSTVSDPAMLHGWDKRPDQWEFEAQRRSTSWLPRVGVEVGYFRRTYGNFTVTDNTLVGASDYSPVQHHRAGRCPAARRRRVHGRSASTTSTRTRWVRSTTSSPWPATTATRSRRWNGVDVNFNVRLRQGILVQGGMSTGRTSTDNCDCGKCRATVDRTSASQLDCHVETAFLTQVKFLGTYTVPKVDVQIAATFRSLPGPQILANHVATELPGAALAWTSALGRRANVTVNIVEPGTMYGEQTNLLDLRFSKLFRFAKYRTSVNLDLANAFNSSGVTTLNNNYAAWQVPTVFTWRVSRRSAPVRFLSLR